MKALLVALVLLPSVGVAGPDGSVAVTNAAFYGASSHLERAFARNLGLPDPPLHTVTNPSAPIKRLEIVGHLDTLMRGYKPRFRVAPRPFPTDMAVIDSLPPKFRDAAKRLVQWGLLSPVGPVLVGPGDSVSPAQAGEALGLFFGQVGNLTHRADPKWTPNINPEDGG